MLQFFKGITFFASFIHKKLNQIHTYIRIYIEENIPVYKYRYFSTFENDITFLQSEHHPINKFLKLILLYHRFVYKYIHFFNNVMMVRVSANQKAIKN